MERAFRSYSRYPFFGKSALSSGNRKILSDSGGISHAQVMKKAREEYQKYQEITISPVEDAYLKTVKMAAKVAKQDARKNKS